MKRRRLIHRLRRAFRAVLQPFGLAAEGLRHLFIFLTDKEAR